MIDAATASTAHEWVEVTTYGQREREFTCNRCLGRRTEPHQPEPGPGQDTSD